LSKSVQSEPAVPSTTYLSEAVSSLSRLVELVESGQQREIIITRNDRPAARLVELEAAPTGQRMGLARWCFTLPERIDASKLAVADLLAGR
jgi:antitoxin (DNA-binding transcriptional repressor) of toxin-antitoxin stability system